jgi:hypothetical protein
MVKSGKGGILSRSWKRGILMLPTRGWIALGLLLAAPALLAQTPAAQTDETAAPAPTPHHESHKTQKPLVLPPLPSGPLSQLPMDQIPSTPAKVSYEGGLLTISAQNSTLGEILRDVRKLTGASIEIPLGPGENERVVTHLGPGAPRDVLAGLLNGSSFNYVMLGSSSDPTAVSSVILTAKPSSSGDPPAAANVAANVYQNNYQNNYRNNPGPVVPNAAMPFRPTPPPPGSAQAADADDKDDDDKDDDSAEDQTQPGQPDANGANANANANGQEQQQPDPTQPNAGPKTPEQMLEMMRRPQQPGAAPVIPPQPAPPPQQ